MGPEKQKKDELRDAQTLRTSEEKLQSQVSVVLSLQDAPSHITHNHLSQCGCRNIDCSKL